MSEQDKSGVRKKLVVIDGKSVFYRGYYAMSNLATKDGTPTGGVFGFASMALEVVRRLKPDYVAVAWDKPKTNIRKRLEIYPEYKAGRKPSPPDFKIQIPLLHELLDAFGWPLYELDDYEADDIMGALAVQARKKDIETILITSDMDMLQLVNDHVHVYALKTGLSNIELYSPKTFEAKHGIKVEQYLDLKSLKGDSSDNIPGVPGIGEKGATELLHQFETLDGIYDNLDLVKDSLRKKLEAGKDLAYISKKLARIWTEAPVKLNLKELDGSKADPEKIQGLLQKLEFRSLVRQLPEIMQINEAIIPKSGKTVIKIGEVQHITSAQKLQKTKLLPTETVIMHSFVAGKNGSKPICIAVSNGDRGSIVIDASKIEEQALADWLKINIPSKTKLIGHDIKLTIKLLLNLGLGTREVDHDILIGAFLINSLTRQQTLTELAEAEIGYTGRGFENMSPEEMLTSAGEIVAIIRTIASNQEKTINQTPKLGRLAKQIEWPVIPVLAEMEFVGIELDSDYLNKFADEINDMISDYEQQIYGYADKEFNIASPSQLAEVLFDGLKLPTNGIKKGKTGLSTAATELDKLRNKHPIIDLITQFREVSKLKNTYVDTLPSQVDEQGRIHTTFNLTVAQTGRLSSSDPNLQNIPIRTELGRRIRTAFIAGKGKKLVSADYSQFELRLAAVLADDKQLIDIFNSGADIHTETAALIYEREEEDVTKQMRSAAKTINFGIIYGMSPHGLSVATGMTNFQAANFIDKYKEVRKPIFEYMDHVKDQAKKDGYVATLFGRRRPMPDINSSNFAIRQGAERAAINMPIQGTEADLMKLAMIKVDGLIKSKFKNCNMLLQIHDSILMECNEEDANEVAHILKSTMEDIYKLPIKLDVDVSIAENWGEL